MTNIRNLTTNFNQHVSHDQVFERFFQQTEWDNPLDQIFWWSDPVYTHLTSILMNAMKAAKMELLNRGGICKEEGLKIKPQNARYVLQTIQRQRSAFAHQCWMEYQRRKIEIERVVVPTHIKPHGTVYYFQPGPDGFTETKMGYVTHIYTTKKGTFVTISEDEEAKEEYVPARYTFATRKQAENYKQPPHPTWEQDSASRIQRQ